MYEQIAQTTEIYTHTHTPYETKSTGYTFQDIARVNFFKIDNLALILGKDYL